jgi:hypothetical protein
MLVTYDQTSVESFGRIMKKRIEVLLACSGCQILYLLFIDKLSNKSSTNDIRLPTYNLALLQAQN